MSREPELSIKVRVDPEVDKDNLEQKIKDQVAELNKNPVSVKISPDVDEFAANLKKAITDSIGSIGGDIDKVFGDLSNKLVKQLNDLSYSLKSTFDIDIVGDRTLDSYAKKLNRIAPDQRQISALAESGSKASLAVEQMLATLSSGNEALAKNIYNQYKDTFTEFNNLFTSFDEDVMNQFDGNKTRLRDLFKSKGIPYNQEKHELDEIIKSAQNASDIYRELSDAISSVESIITGKEQFGEFIDFDDDIIDRLEEARLVLGNFKPQLVKVEGLPALDFATKDLNAYLKAVRSLRRQAGKSGTSESLKQVSDTLSGIAVPELPADAMQKIVDYENAISRSLNDLRTFKEDLEGITGTVGQQENVFGTASGALESYGESLQNIVSNNTTDEFKALAKEFDDIVKGLTASAQEYAKVKKALDDYKKQAAAAEKNTADKTKPAPKAVTPAPKKAPTTPKAPAAALPKATTVKTEKDKEAETLKASITAAKTSVETLASVLDEKKAVITKFLQELGAIGTTAQYAAGESDNLTETLKDQYEQFETLATKASDYYRVLDEHAATTFTSAAAQASITENAVISDVPDELKNTVIEGNTAIQSIIETYKTSGTKAAQELYNEYKEVIGKLYALISDTDLSPKLGLIDADISNIKSTLVKLNGLSDIYVSSAGKKLKSLDNKEISDSLSNLDALSKGYTEIKEKAEEAANVSPVSSEMLQNAVTAVSGLLESLKAMESTLPKISQSLEQISGLLNKVQIDAPVLKSTTKKTSKTGKQSAAADTVTTIPEVKGMTANSANEYSKIAGWIIQTNSTLTDSIERLNTRFAEQQEHLTTKTRAATDEYSRNFGAIIGAADEVKQALDTVNEAISTQAATLNSAISEAATSYTANIETITNAVQALGQQFAAVVENINNQATAYETAIGRMITSAESVPAIPQQPPQPAPQLSPVPEIIDIPELDQTDIEQVQRYAQELGAVGPAAQYANQEADNLNATLDRQQAELVTLINKVHEYIDALNGLSASKDINTKDIAADITVPKPEDAVLQNYAQEIASLGPAIQYIAQEIDALDASLKSQYKSLGAFTEKASEYIHAVSPESIQTLSDNFSQYDTIIKDISASSDKFASKADVLTGKFAAQRDVLKDLSTYSKTYMAAANTAIKNSTSLNVKPVSDNVVAGFAQQISKLGTQINASSDVYLKQDFAAFESFFDEFESSASRSSKALIHLKALFGELQARAQTMNDGLGVSDMALASFEEHVSQLHQEIMDLGDPELLKEFDEFWNRLNSFESTPAKHRWAEDFIAIKSDFGYLKADAAEAKERLAEINDITLDKTKFEINDLAKNIAGLGAYLNPDDADKFDELKTSAEALQAAYNKFQAKPVHYKTDYDELIKQLNEIKNIYKELRNSASDYRKEMQQAEKDAYKASDTDKNLSHLLTEVNNYMRSLKALPGGTDSDAYAQLAELQKVLGIINTIDGTYTNIGRVNEEFTDVANKTDLTRAMSTAMNYGEVVNDLQNRLYDVIDGVKAFQASVKDTASFDRASKRVAVLQNQIQSMLASNSRLAGTEIGNELESMLVQLSKPDAVSNVDQLSLRVAQLRAEIKSTGLEGESLGGTIKKMFGQHLGTAAVMNSIHLLERAFRQIYQNVVDIDSALTQVKIVTGATDAAMKDFAVSAAKAAQQVGATVTEIMSSTETYARLGYSLEEATNMATQTATFARVGDIQVDEATTGITSVLKGFNLSADQVEEVIDKIILISRKYPIDAQGLAEALENGGAALAAAGNSLDESLALIQAGNAATQSPSTVGVTMKSLSARIRSSTAELDDMGEEYNKITESASKYRAEIMQLTRTPTSKGVDILDANGDYRSTYAFLVDIAEVWDEISDKNQAALMEDLAGKRNVSVVQSIITNIQSMKDSLVDAENAAGTTAEANEQVMDSISMKINQLQAAFQELSVDVLDSGLVKGLVDAGTAAINLLDTFTDIAGVLPAIALPASFAAQAAGLSKSMDKVQRSMNGTVDGVLAASQELSKFPDILQKYMLAGQFSIGSGQKVTLADSNIDTQSANIKNYLAQIAMLSDKEKEISIGLTDISSSTEIAGMSVGRMIAKMSDASNETQLLSSALYQQKLAQNGLSTEVQNTILKTAGLVDASGKYTVMARGEMAEAINKVVTSDINLIDSDVKLQDALTQQGVSVKNLTEDFINYVSALQASNSIAKTHTVTQIALNTALKIGKQLLMSLAVSAAVYALNQLVNYFMNLKSAAEQANDALKDSQAALSDTQNEISTIEGKLDDLNDKVKETGAEKISEIVDPEEREKIQSVNDLLETQLELKRKLEKDQRNDVNENASAVLNTRSEKSSNLDPGVFVKYITPVERLGEVTDELTAKTNEYLQAKAQDDGTELSAQNIAQLESELQMLGNEADNLQQTVMGQAAAYDMDAENIGQYKVEVANATRAVNNATDAIAAMNDALNDTVTSKAQDNIEALEHKLEQYLADANSIIGNTKMSRSDLNIDNWLAGIQNGGALKGLSGDYIKSLFAGTIEPTKEQAAALENLNNMAESSNVTFEALVNLLESFGLVASNATIEVENLDDTIDAMQTAYGSLATAVEEYNKHGYMSIDALQELIALDPKYLSCLELVNGQLKINRDALIDLAVARYNEMKTTVISNAIDQLTALALEDVESASEDVKEATEAQKQAFSDATGVAKKYAGELFRVGSAEAFAAAYGEATGDNEEKKAAADKIVENMETQLDLIDKQIATIMSSSTAYKNQLAGFETKSSSSKSADKSSDAIKNLSGAFDTLTAAVKEYNQYGAITIDTLQSLYELEDKYTECLVDETDAQGNLTGRLAINTDKYLELLQAQIKEAQKQAQTSDDAKKSAAELQRIYDYLSESAKGTTISISELTDVISGFGTALDNAQSDSDSFKSAFETVYNTMQDIAENNGMLDYDTMTGIVDMIQEHEELKDVLYDETGALQINEDTLKATTVALLKAIQASTDNVQIQQTIQKVIDDVNSGVLESTDYWLGYGSVLDQINETLDGFQSGYDDLFSIVDEYNTYGALTQDSYQKLLQLSPEYLACLEYENGKLSLNTEAFKQLYLAELRELALKYEGTDAGKIYAAMLEDVESGVVSLRDHMDGLGTELDEISSKFDTLVTILNSISGWFTDALDDQSNALQIWGDAVIDELDNRIDALEEEKEALEEQKEALQDANDEEERAITLAKLKDDLARAQSQRTVRQYTDNGYEWVTDASAIKDAEDALSDQLREWNLDDAIDSLDDLEDAIDDQIDTLNDLKEQYQDVIELIGTSWEDYEAQLAAAAAIQGMSLDEMESQLTDYKASVIANMQAIQAATNFESTILNLQSVISLIGNVLDLFGSDWYSLLNNIFSVFSGDSTSSNNGLLSKIGSVFSSFGEKASSGFATGLNTIKNKALNVLSGLGDAIGSFFGGSGGLISNMTTWGGSLVNALVNGISTAGSGILEVVGNIVSGGFGGIINTVGTLLGSLGTFVSGGLGSIVTNVSGILGTLGTALGEGLGGIIGSLTTAISGAAAGTGVLGTVLSGLTGPVGIAIAAIGGLVTAIGSANGGDGLIGSFITGIKTILGTAYDVISGIGESIANIFSGASEGVKTFISGVATFLISPVAGLINLFGGLFGFASGTKSVPVSSVYNVDEEGEEIIVRAPKSGRAAYLEAGDGVVPADITEKLFEMGGDPSGWFASEFGKMVSDFDTVTTGANLSNTNISVGDITITQPVGDVNALSKQIVQRLPLQLKQDVDKR